MENRDRTYTSEEFEELFKKSGIDVIAKDYCWEELCEWMDSLRDTTLREFNTLREAAWHNLLRFSHPNVYAEQRKNGKSHKWSKAFAEAAESYDGRSDKLYMCIQESFDSVDESERNKELTIFFESFSDDPIFNRISKQYFYKVDCEEWLKLSKEYTSEFYKCKENGKSDIFADAYADASTSGFVEKYCNIFAEIKESATNKGQNDFDSDYFARFCAENYGNQTLLTSIRDFKNFFNESWQKEIYYNLILRDEEERTGRITNSYKIAMREELGLPSNDNAISSED